MNANTLRLAPLVIMLLLAFAMAMGLFNGTSSQRDASLVGMRINPFTLPSLDAQTGRFTPKSWKGQVAVLNVFASWCEPCAAEHPELLRLSQSGNINLYGMAWKDSPQKVANWLAANGNPYRSVGIDAQGQTTVALALTGIPETFIIDKKGVIAWHYRQPLTADIINSVMLPLIEKLNNTNAQ